MTPRSLHGPVRTFRSSNAPSQPARACGPSIAGAPPQHPDVGRMCRCAASGKHRVTLPARSLLPSWGCRLIETKPLSPLAARASTPGRSRHHSRATPRCGTSLTAPAHAWPAQAQLRCAQRHSFTATGPLRRRCRPSAHQPEGEHKEVPPRRGSRPCDRDGDRSPSLDSPGPRAFYRCIQKSAVLLTASHLGYEPWCMVGRLPARLSGRRSG
jgi:hypothetical protein